MAPARGLCGAEGEGEGEGEAAGEKALRRERTDMGRNGGIWGVALCRKWWARQDALLRNCKGDVECLGVVLIVNCTVDSSTVYTVGS